MDNFDNINNQNGLNNISPIEPVVQPLFVDVSNTNTPVFGQTVSSTENESNTEKETESEKDPQTETEEIIICGKKFTVGKINYDICKNCENGACVNRFSADSHFLRKLRHCVAGIFRKKR